MNGTFPGDIITQQEVRAEFDRKWLEDPRTKLRREEIEEILGADLRLVEDLTIDAAREIVRQMVYLLMHMVYDENGRLANRIETQQIIRTFYPKLLEAANLKLSLATVENYRAEMANRVWDEKYPDIMKLTEERFRTRLQQIEMIMPQIMEAIASGDLKAVPDFATMVKLEEGILGYAAATKVAVFMKEDDRNLSDRDVLMAARANAAAADYDTKLLLEKIGEAAGGVVDGELIDRDRLHEAMLQAAETAKAGLDEFVGEIAEEIDQQVRERTGIDREEDDGEDVRHL